LHVASAIDVIVTVLFNVLHNNKLMPTCVPLNMEFYKNFVLVSSSLQLLTEDGIKIFLVPQGHLKIYRVGRPVA
jgi:hypothetical protein